MGSCNTSNVWYTRGAYLPFLTCYRIIEHNIQDNTISIIPLSLVVRSQVFLPSGKTSFLQLHRFSHKNGCWHLLNVLKHFQLLETSSLIHLLKKIGWISSLSAIEINVRLCDIVFFFFLIDLRAPHAKQLCPFKGIKANDQQESPQMEFCFTKVYGTVKFSCYIDYLVELQSCRHRTVERNILHQPLLGVLVITEHSLQHAALCCLTWCTPDEVVRSSVRENPSSFFIDVISSFLSIVSFDLNRKK